jgi:L-Ala-D/L-Glu epimerase
MLKLILHKYDLQLKHTFKIAHDSRDIQKTLVVELKGDNFSGFGEATANKYYHNTIEGMVSTLEKYKSEIVSYNFEEPELFWEKIKLLFWDNSFALCAIDVAINDIYAKSKQTSLMELWRDGSENTPLSNYTIGIDSIEMMAKKMKEFSWPLYKIKLGTNEDLRIIKELRKLTDAAFRVDANCAWTPQETLINAVAMKSLGVEFIEQPLAADNWEGMKLLFEKSVLPIMADESLISEGDVERCFGYFHGVNIKLMKCGGFTPARRMIKKAKSLGMKVMVGCMTETAVGISAVGQLTPWLDFIDMDGSTLITNDIAEGPKFIEGKVILPEGNGIGVASIKPSNQML